MNNKLIVYMRLDVRKPDYPEGSWPLAHLRQFLPLCSYTIISWYHPVDFSVRQGWLLNLYIYFIHLRHTWLLIEWHCMSIDGSLTTHACALIFGCLFHNISCYFSIPMAPVSVIYFLAITSVYYTLQSRLYSILYNHIWKCNNCFSQSRLYSILYMKM